MVSKRGNLGDSRIVRYFQNKKRTVERYNRKDKQLRIIRQGDFVIAERTVDLDVGSETEQLVREADAFAVKIDNLFRTIPKNLIGR